MTPDATTQTSEERSVRQPPMRLLVLSAILPKRSETFVYREVLGLRSRGVPVAVASLYPCERDLGDPALDALSDEVIPIYATGAGQLFRDASRFAASAPFRAARALSMAVWDSMTGGDVQMKDRPKLPYQGIAGLALAERIKRKGITHLHMHMAHSPASVGMYAAAALQRPFSFTGHAADLFRDRALLTRKLRRAAFVACISHWHRAFYQETCPRSEDHYPIVRCGVDVPDIPVTERRSGPFHLLGVGRLVPKKGFDLLIRSVAGLRNRGLNARCVLAGDGPERESLLSLADGLGLGRMIEFHGSVAHSAIPALLREADVFVLPCRVDQKGDRDGIPVVLMEAMASGLCAVSGDLPAIRELIEDGRSGRLVPPGDSSRLTEVLSSLALDPGGRTALAAGGRSRVQEEFSSPTNLDRLVHAFEKQAHS